MNVNVPNDDHFVVLLVVKDGLVGDLETRLLVSLGHEKQGFGSSGWRLQEALPVGILAHAFQDRFARVRHLFQHLWIVRSVGYRLGGSVGCHGCGHWWLICYWYRSVIVVGRFRFAIVDSVLSHRIMFSGVAPLLEITVQQPVPRGLAGAADANLAARQSADWIGFGAQ